MAAMCSIVMSETAYVCKKYKCAVRQLPCPHCGDEDHPSTEAL